ncbi:hypothetical protein EV700_0049 [Fluviicoccus keumensis]|uniref:DNA-binding protein n=1 Tax=Fluviicoccus keumensis TaxID=1435465 RepID=A0A4Q7ZCA3_9GAMM|nr:hypothetical protein [Fluviicoccus keumensis]RZU48258.1 hypothetical protein EV700_0049 [Fluviicoccus keumensis]
MSLHAQEEVLFHLLFDRRLRDRFRRDPATALASYRLSAEEIRDFAAIRHDALEFEAGLRAGLILSQLCRSFPLSFSLVSSLHGGLETLKALIDTDTMQEHPLERATAFAARLRAWIDEDSPEPEDVRGGVLDILDAETGMARSSAIVRFMTMQDESAPEADAAIPEHWENLRLTLATGVDAARLPRPYAELKACLCAGGGAELWRRLERQPLTAADRDHALRAENPRLLVSRAVIIGNSRCEPEVEHRFLELPDGFSALVGHLDGETDVAAILTQMRAAGAADPLLSGIRQGFRELLANGMLTCA